MKTWLSFDLCIQLKAYMQVSTCFTGADLSCWPSPQGFMALSSEQDRDGRASGSQGILTRKLAGKELSQVILPFNLFHYFIWLQWIGIILPGTYLALHHRDGPFTHHVFKWSGSHIKCLIWFFFYVQHFKHIYLHGKLTFLKLLCSWNWAREHPKERDTDVLKY